MFSFQPAEMAKIALVLFASWMLSRAQNSKEQMKIAFYWVTGVTAAVCFLIFLSNFSTAAMIFLSIMVLMFIARVPILRIAILGLIGLAFGVVLYFSVDLLPDTFGRVHTFKERISDFVSGDKEEAVGTTQADYAKLAIFEGGVIGKGPGNSEVSNYMEAAYNDFIYAIVIEEYGIVGGAILMLLYLILLFRGIAIVRRCERTFPAFMVTGLVLIMIFQAFINMGVSAGAVPVTGQPLPWVSMGGSSMIFTSFSLGIILSVSANNQRSKKAVEQPIADEVVTEDQTM
jgi:cell division protein FtsW